MSIRSELRLRAEKRLHALLEQMRDSAAVICDGSFVEPNDLMRLAIGARTQALLNKVIARMADAQEASLLSRLEDEAD